ncbi:hypothetical protein O6H91_21G066200 [Diphasiastrum complanatum]|uniref:Uncharacterized protein n=1 Tax=Diphasiastrum complanatum TaxID=34168 RepID=A0ACC2ALG1_DIPCM|nr:hypothetical protein O6H91_Y026000 [Diphasiastrum complanatum]KAJ7518380.1 hypothetical protein O6H91_21G066200 [Diphasiastrum complanatum]
MAESFSSFDEDEGFFDGPCNGKQVLECASHSAAISKPDSRSKRRSSIRPSLETEDFMNLLHGSDPIKVELNRLENEVRDKDRELGEAQAEIKALKLTERLKEKAVEELSEELEKAYEKLKATEILLDNKNLEVKKIVDEKKASLAAQFAAEATLRRVHAAQKDEDMPPIEAILAPLEAELKLSRQEVAKLQEDNRALDRLTKSKEAALLEAERTVQIAEAKASMVDDLQNRNQELLKQIEICQEENKILDKMHRQKIAEVEKLSTTVAELEEAVLAGAAAANAVRDHQRQVHELMEEKKTLERELARAKITANRVAVVVANEWKDANDKVMPVRQWLEERRFMQGDMQQLRDKLASAERTAKNESQMKEKFQVRIKVLEETLRTCTNGSARRNTASTSEDSLRTGSNGPARRQSTGFEEAPKLELVEDSVSGFLYDMLQKEVISLRKLSHEKDQSLKDKDDAIEMLSKKVDTLTKAMEVEAKKMRREVAVKEKEVAAMKLDKEQEHKARRLSISKGIVNSSAQLLSGRSLKSP